MTGPTDTIQRLKAALGDRYVIEGELGAGGMARVFVATDPGLERRIVVKVLAPELAASVSLQRFQREIKLAASLQHANIVPLLAAGDADGIPYYTMPLVAGDSLRARLQGSGRPGFAETLTILRDVARALAYAHERGVVHRDIKPENVLLSSGAAVVADFGIAKAVASARVDGNGPGTGSTLTQLGTTIGTPAYMAPEQIAADPAIDHRADIYSYGCVAYELLTGRPPFQGRSTHALFSSHLADQPVSISSQNPACPPALARVVMRCLEKDPSARPQSAGEILDVLNGITAPASGFQRVLHWLPGPFRSAGTGVGMRAAWIALGAVAITVGVVLLRERPALPPPQSEWVQLTDFNDGASAPALSSDGRFLAFTRGPGAFMAEGQVYVKLLPDGEPLELTRDSLGKIDPTFSPDGSRIAYGVTQGFEWQTWEVPLIGGGPRLMLRNSTGLQWIGPREVMFSEITTGIHMQVVTANESRASNRLVYVPEKETLMAHRSYLSPDRRHVLIAEMDVATWLPCRVVPFDGSSRGWQVGPPEGGCNSAAWSPDGRTIYVTSNAGGRGFHLWRQKFPRGEPEQLTFGPTEEQGIAVAPDGRSLITAVGEAESSVWLYTPRGETQLTSEGFAYGPYLTTDGERVYYVQRLRSGATAAPQANSGSLHLSPGVLRVRNLRTGTTETFFPDFPVLGYSVSPDERTILLGTIAADGRQHWWTAPLDRRSPPRRLENVGMRYARFLSNDEIAYLVCEPDETCRPYRQRIDGSEPSPLFGGAQLTHLLDVSPDGTWMTIAVPAPESAGSLLPLAANLATGEQVRICDFCFSRWSRDGRHLLVSVAPPGNQGLTWAVPIPEGRSLPAIPSGGWQPDDFPKIPGARRLSGEPGRSWSVDTYPSTQETFRRNLYRIPLR